MAEFTLSANIHITKSDSTSRNVLYSTSTAVGDLTHGFDNLKLAVPVDDQITVPLGSVGLVNFLHIWTDQDITIKINGADLGFGLSAGGVFTLVNCELTSVILISNSTSQADVRVTLAGILD